MSADPNPNKKPVIKKRKITVKPIAEIIDTPVTSSNPAETQTMEVHHHPEVEKKALRDYVLEGLMIFIAVTMGFFAESLREHINEHNKEKEYMQTFVQDLRTDSVNMCASIDRIDSVRNNMHSLIMLINSPDRAKYGARIYYYARISTTNLTFHADDRTLTQLKNSGGFSLIKNSAAVDSITAYESQVERYGLTNSIALQEAQLTYPYMAKLFNAMVFESMVTNKYTITMPAGNPQLVSNDPAAINELTYFLHQRESTLIASKVFLKKVQLREKNTFHFINQQYHLEN